MQKIIISPPRDVTELLERSSKLAGKTIGELANGFGMKVPKELKFAKGWMGQLLEKSLGATAMSLPEPDFQELGIELKTIPVSLNGKPCESTYICSISLCSLVGLTWENSLVKKKLSHVLWVPIEYDKHLIIAERRIGYPILWRPTKEQENIIRRDWEELVEMMSTGQIEEIKGTIGEYLQVRPKAANSKSVCYGIDNQGDRSLTLPRGFYLRAKFTEQILKDNYSM